MITKARRVERRRRESFVEMVGVPLSEFFGEV